MPWTRKRTSPSFAGLLLEDADELLADDLALRLRVGRRRRAGSGTAPRARTCTSGTWKWPPKVSTTCSASFARMQPVVDEDARELVADRLVDEQRGDGRVDAAREAADDALRADLRADPLDLLLDHGGRRPARRRARDLVEEVLQDLLALGRVHDLRVELDGVVATRRDPRRPRSASTATRPSTRAPGGGAVTESRWLIHTTWSGGRSRKSADSPSVGVRLAVLGDVVRLDGAAEVARHQLHPVTDAERRDPELEHGRVQLGRALGVDRGRAAGEDERERVARRDLGGREPVR